MSKSRKRKPKPKVQAPPVRRAPPKKWWTPLRKATAGAIAFVGLPASVWFFAPSVLVSVGQAPHLEAGSFGTFQIENRSAYPIENVRVAFGLCEIFAGPETADHEPHKKCGNNMAQLHYTKWEYARINSGQSVTMSIDDGFKARVIGYADIGITVYFEPWFFGETLISSTRFTSEKLNDGRYVWYQK